MIKLIFTKFMRNYKLFLGTVIAIAVTMAIIGACLNLVSGCIDSSSYGGRFSACDVVISKNSTLSIDVDYGDKVKTESETASSNMVFTDDELSEIETAFENEKLIYDYSFYISVSGAGGVVGHNFSSYELSGFSVSVFEILDNQVVLDEQIFESLNVDFGDEIDIYVAGFVSTFTIVGVAECDDESVYEGQNYIFFSDDLAQQSAIGAYNVGVFTSDISGVCSTAKSLGFKVFSGDKINEGEIYYSVTDYFSAMIVFITMGSICLLASVFVIFGTITFSVKHRLREFGLLRAIGLSRAQLNVALVVENIVVLAVGVAIGLFMSIPISMLIRSLFIGIGIIDAAFSIGLNIFMLLIAVGGIVLVTLLVALLVGNKAFSVSVMQAIKEDEKEEKKGFWARFIVGITLFLGALSIIIFTPYYSGLGIGMGFCACGLLLGSGFLFAPVLMKFINAVSGIFTKNMHKSLGVVAKGNVKVKASKFAIAAMALALMFALNAVMYLNNVSYISDNAANQMQYFSSFSHYITAVNAGEIDSQDEENALSVKYGSVIYSTDNNIEAVGVMGVSDFTLLNVVLDGDYPCSESEILASEVLGFEMGEVISIYDVSGVASEFIVSGVYENKYDYNFESGIPDIIMGLDFVANCSFNSTIDKVYFSFSDSEAEQFLTSELGKNYELFENDIASYSESAEFNVQTAATLLMTMISICLTIVALFNTFAMIMNVRRKEFNGLRLIGAEKWQILKMTLIETLIVVATGLFIGVAFTIICVSPFSFAAFGTLDFVVSPSYFFTLLGSVCGLGILAGFLPSVIVLSGIKGASK